MSEYPHPPWQPFFGETSAPPVSLPQFALSPRNSPHPWRNCNRNYSPFPNTISIASNLGTVGSQQGPQPIPHGNGYETNAPRYNQSSLSATLKEIFIHRIAHPNSEVVAFQTETSGNGKSKVTVTFEIAGEM